jgi:putative transposase
MMHYLADDFPGRDFKVCEPDKARVSDITYIWADEGWLYPAVFLDLYSRMIVGWSMSERASSGSVVSAFEMGQGRRASTASPLIHSGRGSRYAGATFRERLAAHNCKRSMSRRGNCWDNAVAGSFFGVLKLELVYDEGFGKRQRARDSVFEYIEVYYNRSRIHSAAGYLTPAEYEQKFRRAA